MINSAEMLQRYLRFYDSLMDEESKIICDRRMEYLLYRDLGKLRIDFVKDCRLWKIPELDRAVLEYPEYKHIIIFGAGADGEYTYNLLRQSKYKTDDIVFCDNDTEKQNTYLGTRVLSMNDVCAHYRESIVIVSSSLYALGIIRQLSQNGFFGKRVVVPFKGRLYGVKGCQYFDVFEPKKKEVFVDCGCYDGSTVNEFEKWCNGEYKQIISFEANPEFFDRCKKAVGG